jgi:hypothetical protein
VNSTGDGRSRPRRPASLDAAAADRLPGAGDPAQLVELAHTTAQMLVHRGRSSDDPAVLARLLALVEDEGLSTVAALWSASPSDTLPGALWRLYALRTWVRSDPELVADRYRQGVAAAPVHDVVAGVASPPGAQDVVTLVDAVLTGLYRRDLDVALDRAAAFCRVVATGTAFDADHLDLADPHGAARTTTGAASLQRTAEELSAAARLWRLDRLD